ncbi:MAG TPA: hypothetical protein VNE39_19435 [Planctomycetota bacterium]|nr:hypothetical protein [Planctomycetota bacterium]
MSRWARQLVVTVSVEPDDPSVVGRSGAYRSLDGLERFHELCRRYGVRPTYLATYSAAGETRCVDLFRSCGDEAEVGAHLHPEEVPPIAEGERGNHTLRPSAVEPGRLREKLANLVERVAEAAGRRPTAYRAGFFDLTPSQVVALVGLGIEADSSLGPLEKVGGKYPFLRVPFEPYVADPANPCTEAHASRVTRHASLVEVPLTSVFRRPFPRRLFGVYFGMPGVVRGALRALGAAEVLRFRPAVASADDLLAVCRRTERLGVPAVMTIHSNELWPGTSAGSHLHLAPGGEVRNEDVTPEAACAAYFERLERVFAHCQADGWASRTLTEIARATRGNAG